MDFVHFLRERLTFIRAFYCRSSAPFRETMSAVEEGRPPFDEPPYCEDGEPAFLTEWMDTQVSLDVLGRTCVSMLSASLELYFKARETGLRFDWPEATRKKAFKKGRVRGYRAYFEAALGVSWEQSGVDLDLLEQIVLARNSDQHPDDLTACGFPTR
jgi:hypothetical protein